MFMLNLRKDHLFCHSQISWDNNLSKLSQNTTNRKVMVGNWRGWNHTVSQPCTILKILLVWHLNRCFYTLTKRGIVTHDFSVCWVMSQSRESQPEPDPRCAKRWDLMNTLGLFKSNQYSCEPEPQVKRVSLSKRSSNVFPAECKEDEIFRHTTPLFLLRSKSPLGPSGVNKGRCSKWYANWKEGGKKRSCTNQLANPAFPTLHILKENFSI